MIFCKQYLSTTNATEELNYGWDEYLDALYEDAEDMGEEAKKENEKTDYEYYPDDYDKELDEEEEQDHIILPSCGKFIFHFFFFFE